MFNLILKKEESFNYFLYFNSKLNSSSPIRKAIITLLIQDFQFGAMLFLPLITYLRKIHFYIC